MEHKDAISEKEERRLKAKHNSKHRAPEPRSHQKHEWDRRNYKQSENYDNSDDEAYYDESDADDVVDDVSDKMTRLRLPNVKKNGQRELVTGSSNSIYGDAGQSDEHSDSEITKRSDRSERDRRQVVRKRDKSPRKRNTSPRKNDHYNPHSESPVSQRRAKKVDTSDRGRMSETKDTAYSESPRRKPRAKELVQNTEAKNEKRGSMYEDHPILRYVQENVIGTDLVIDAPFGQREVVYCDYTASGRSLVFIEDYIREHVMPAYANTHSTTGHNARQTGKFREEARVIIRKSVNATSDDAVVFTGPGATAGINKLAWALKLNIPRVAADTAVFIGPYEHHSNILIWRELGTKVIRIRQEADTGQIDLHHLQEELQFWKEKRRQLLVTMSAASNVTGIVTDTDAVARIAHTHGALAVFDFAAGAPYMKIDMNPRRGEYKDAIILSPHKFVGGPGTPGLLIAKKWVFKNSVPDRVGGGTVRFVTREEHVYVGNIEEKEEGGTPAIIESIRAGMVFKLKEEIGANVIESREEELCNRAFAVWEQNPCIYVMGSHTAHRVPIFSFLTKHLETGRLIHHNFISTLLSDLYGIQARGGCACAGPYAEDLMGISEQTAKKYMWFLSEKKQMRDKNNPGPKVHMEIMKPGFTRINLAYFIDDDTIDYVIKAVDDVTRWGWKLLPLYTFDVKTGSWTHKSFSNMPASELDSLEDFDPATYKLSQHKERKDTMSQEDVLERAREIYDEATVDRKPRIASASLFLREALPNDKRWLKWFLTPHDAATILADKEQHYLEKKKYKLPFFLLPIEPRTDADDDSAIGTEPDKISYDEEHDIRDNYHHSGDRYEDKHSQRRKKHKNADRLPPLVGVKKTDARFSRDDVRDIHHSTRVKHKYRVDTER